MRLKALSLGLAAVLAVGCTDQATSPTALNDGAVPAPTFDWQNNPDNGNPLIFRDLTDFIFCFSDAAGDPAGNGLRACMSTLPLGGGSEPDCGLQDAADPVQFQDVGFFDENDPFSSWIHEVGKGDIYITVRDLNTAGSCFGSALVAEGWGRLVWNDNDIFGTTVHNANTWGFRGHGQLTAPDGSKVVYNGHIRFIFGNTIPFKVLTAKVNAH